MAIQNHFVIRSQATSGKWGQGSGGNVAAYTSTPFFDTQTKISTKESFKFFFLLWENRMQALGCLADLRIKFLIFLKNPI